VTNGSGDARYARMRDLLDLCIALQGTVRGLSLDDVSKRYDCSSRTARRMLTAVREAVGENSLQTEMTPDRVKRWRLSRSQVGSLVRWEAADLAALEAAAKRAERDGLSEEAATLRTAQNKLRASMKPDVVSRMDPDLEVLLEAQGVAMRAGPHPRVDREVIDDLRHAILACRRVRLFHRSGESGALRRHMVSPLGFLHGNRHYLVAWSPKRERPILFRLSRIERAKLLDEAFEPPPNFDLRRYAEESFGSFHEERVDVVWRFRPDAAAEAREYCFHPNQRMEEAEDGSLLVRFHAGGLREMAWHLFTWGPAVEVIEPPELRDQLLSLLAEALISHRSPRRPLHARRAERPAAITGSTSS
jgi:predicted DNA-binding transcriptional regulator YafY